MELGVELGLQKEVKGGRGSAGSRAARGCSGRSEGTRSRVAPGLAWAVALEGVGEEGFRGPCCALVWLASQGEVPHQFGDGARASPGLWQPFFSRCVQTDERSAPPAPLEAGVLSSCVCVCPPEVGSLRSVCAHRPARPWDCFGDGVLLAGTCLQPWEEPHLQVWLWAWEVCILIMYLQLW